MRESWRGWSLVMLFAKIMHLATYPMSGHISAPAQTLCCMSQHCIPTHATWIHFPAPPPRAPKAQHWLPPHVHPSHVENSPLTCWPHPEPCNVCFSRRAIHGTEKNRQTHISSNLIIKNCCLLMFNKTLGLLRFPAKSFINMNLIILLVEPIGITIIMTWASISAIPNNVWIGRGNCKGDPPIQYIRKPENLTNVRIIVEQLITSDAIANVVHTAGKIMTPFTIIPAENSWAVTEVARNDY